MEKIRKAKDDLKKTITTSYVGTSKSKYDKRDSPYRNSMSLDQSCKSEKIKNHLNRKLEEIDSKFQSIYASPINKRLFNDSINLHNIMFEDMRFLDLNCFFIATQEAIRCEVLSFFFKSKFVVQADNASGIKAYQNKLKILVKIRANTNPLCGVVLHKIEGDAVEFKKLANSLIKSLQALEKPEPLLNKANQVESDCKFTEEM